MSFTINIDTGGTFTDGFFARGTDVQTAKVLTTPHDLTVCLMDCIKEGAARYGQTVEEMLKNVEIIRYSTTIGTNSIIQRKGSKLGLVVSSGFEEDVYGGSKNSAPKDPLYLFLSPEMIVGVSSEIGSDGREIQPLSKQEVLSQVQMLIDRGARAIVVSLLNSFTNPVHEQQIKKMIKEEFPRYYLGTPTVFLASEISDRPGERLRTNTTVLNAYIHRGMARYLYKAEEDLRQKFYDRPLLVVHNSGGVARVAKTKALSTYNSGPVAGLVGANGIRNRYSLQNIVSTDMGGTSMDIGIIQGEQFNIEPQPTIAGLKINQAMIEIKAIGAGGGSIAWIVDGRVEVGPESTGSLPGPACFNLGGSRPTVTDADLVMGFIDPEYFLGGRIKLVPDRAVEAIRREIASPLGISVEEAASLIKQKVDDNIALQIKNYINQRGQEFKVDAVLAYGGAGPTHCCGYTRGLDVSRVITSPFSSVFSAYGLSNMDVTHKYAWSRELPLNGNNEETAGLINHYIDNLKTAAYRDMHAEGFTNEQITFYLEVFGKKIKADGAEEKFLLAAENLSVNHLKELSQSIFMLSSVVLSATVAIPHQEVVKFNTQSISPDRAKSGERMVFWPEERKYCAIAVYRREKLAAGNVVPGPAIIESADTTYIIHKNYRFSVDEYLNGIIEEVK